MCKSFQQMEKNCFFFTQNLTLSSFQVGRWGVRLEDLAARLMGETSTTDRVKEIAGTHVAQKECVASHNPLLISLGQGLMRRGNLIRFSATAGSEDDRHPAGCACGERVSLSAGIRPFLCVYRKTAHLGRHKHIWREEAAALI